ncbi:hypothetical protein [Pseudoalteromonas obscura]|uniref:Lipoprotein n=1 Tax=Pseudoalteromonas obscura TaxID=3048491 RepID=A0ABT7ENI9_9GAMM|nr:hypothetical protein [Pseudoalteromonas sp. P94(2023)]MDK2596617.1 hypothetical protein [Pseudoalteromonas sp. P94(2023)]
MNKIVIAMVFCAVIAGCSSVDKAVFVTKTSISVIDVDSTPSEVSLAYDRTEGFIGPNYENGSVPSVVGSFSSDGKIISPKIKQVYATGEAANLVVDDGAPKYTPVEQDKHKTNGKDDKKTLFFGTSTSLGFKFGVQNTNPTFLLGYRRKEASYIPLRKNSDGEEVYSSVLASIDTSISKSDGGEFTHGQYFATGVAAKKMASQDIVQKAFRKRAKSALEQYDDENRRQSDSLSKLSSCALRMTSVANWKSIVDSAAVAGLFKDADAVGVELNDYAGATKAENLLELIAIYIDELKVGKVITSSEHSLLLEKHSLHICKLADEEAQ